MKKLTVFQILLGTLIVLIGALAASGTFSSIKFVYFYPLGSKIPGIGSGQPVQILRPDVLNFACAATIVVVLIGLLVVIKNAAYLVNANKGKGIKSYVMLGILIVLIDALALGAAFLTPITLGDNGPEALKVARWAMEAILPMGTLVIIVGLLKLVYTKKSLTHPLGTL
jgi:hypothetical protein